MESAMLSRSKHSTQLQLGIPHDKLAHAKVSTFAEASSLEAEKRDYSSFDLPANDGNDSERNEDQVPLYTPMDAWDDYSSTSMKKQGDSEWKEMGAGRDARLGKCMLYNLGLAKISPSIGQDDSKVSLDLQLKMPSRPQPRFNWLDISPGKIDSDAEMLDLSLSLVSNHIKPKSCDKGENREVEVDLHNWTGVVHVNSEPCQEDETTGRSNLIADCSGSTKSTPIDDQPQKHPEGIGDVSPPKVMTYDRKTTNIMEVPQNSCVNKAKYFYGKFENSCGSMVEDCYKQFEIDLNSLPVDSYDGFHTPSNSGKCMEANEILAEVAQELVLQEHCDTQDHNELPESSSLLNDIDGKVTKSSIFVPEPMEFEQKELYLAKDVIGADGMESEVSQGNKPAAPDALPEDVSKISAPDGNDSISLKVAFDEVPMELRGNDDVTESDQELEEHEEVLEEESCDETGDVEESEEEIEEFEEVSEDGCCEDESDSSDRVVGDGDTEIEEIAEILEEVSSNDESGHDEYGDGKVRVQREESALHGKEGPNSVPSTSPTMMPLGDVIGKHIQNPEECTDKRKLEVTMLENLQPSALDAPSTTKKRLLNATLMTDRDWETKSGRNKDIVEASEEGKQGWGTWETESSLNKDITEATGKGSYNVSRQKNARKMHSAAHSDASKHEVSWVKQGKVTKFNTGPNRSSQGKVKLNHARPISDKSSSPDKPHPRWSQDGRRNEPFYRPENNRNHANQFGMRRSDYTWVRKDHGQSDDASQCNWKFPRTEDARECADAVPSSRMQVHKTREGQIQLGSQMINHTKRDISLSGRYIGRNNPDFQIPQAHEGRVTMRDLPSSIANHPPFSHLNQRYVQTEDIMQRRATDPCSFRSSPTSLEHPSQAWLRYPPKSERVKMQSSHQLVYYPRNMIAPTHDTTPDHASNISPSGLQYSVPHTILQRNINLRRREIDSRQTREESFRHLHVNHDGEQIADAESFDERHYGVWNGPTQHAAYGQHFPERGTSHGNIWNRLGDTSNGEQTVGAEFCDERYYGVENGSSPAQYGHELHKKFHGRGKFHGRVNPREYKRNIRNRLGDSSNWKRQVPR